MDLNVFEGEIRSRYPDTQEKRIEKWHHFKDATLKYPFHWFWTQFSDD